jgi:LysM repeat protein
MRSLLIVLLVMVALLAAGCWQPAGDNDPFSTPVSRALPSPTATDTETPAPATPTPEFEITPDAEAASGEVVTTPDPIVVAQQPTIDPLIQEATDTILRRTQEILSMTQTAEGFFQIPTETWTPEFAFATPTVPVGGGGEIIQPPTGGGSITGCQHTVEQGQNLFRISLLYRVRVDELVATNGIANRNLITVGRVLTIPNCGNTNPSPPAVDPNGGFAPGYNWTNNVVGNVPHIVSAGETLFSISLRYRVPMLKIAAANAISNINVLSIGQQLIIP